MSENGKHTPGPWKISANDEGRCDITAGDDARHIVRVPWTALHHQEGEPGRRSEYLANARLIAAVPGLLAVCERAVAAIPHIKTHGQYYADPILADLRAEIAKATC